MRLDEQRRLLVAGPATTLQQALNFLDGRGLTLDLGHLSTYSNLTLAGMLLSGRLRRPGAAVTQ